MTDLTIRRGGIPGPGSDALQPLVDEAEAAAEAAEAAAEAVEEALFSSRTWGVPLPIGGNLPNGAPRLQGSFLFGTPTVVPATRDELLQVGVTHVVSNADGANSFFVLTYREPVVPGDWVIGSVIVEKDNSVDWPEDDELVVALGNVPVSGNQQNFSAALLSPLSFYEDIATNMRRYVVGGQLGVASPGSLNVVTAPLLYSFIGLYNSTGATLKGAAYSMATSQRELFDILWRLWDPFNAGDLLARVAQLDGGVGVQNTPELLAPSSYFAIEGRPLSLYKARMTEYEEASAFDIAAIGSKGTLPGVIWDNGRVLSLLGERLSGAGAIRAMTAKTDTLTIFNRSVNFYSSVATKSGTKRVLAIGDSLTHGGWVSALEAKMTEGGLTPQMIGTFEDIQGTLCEGRPSWHSQSYTYQQRAVNTDGSGQSYPVRTGAGSGVTFSVTRSGGAITSITASGGSGYDNHTVIPLVISGGGGASAFATVAVSGGVPGAVTIVTGGTGYTTDPLIAMPPTVAEYLALADDPSGYGPNWPYNPFIRPATGGDPSDRVFNGYIFDLDFYLTRFSLADPDFIFIALGVNDILTSEPTANIITALNVLLDQCNAALPGVPVFFSLPGLGNTAPTGWQGVISLFKAQVIEYGNREDEDIYLLPFFQGADPKLTFPLAVSAENSIGVQTTTPTETIHPVVAGVGHSQWAEMAYAAVMCLS